MTDLDDLFRQLRDTTNKLEKAIAEEHPDVDIGALRLTISDIEYEIEHPDDPWDGISSCWEDSQCSDE